MKKRRQLLVIVLAAATLLAISIFAFGRKPAAAGPQMAVNAAEGPIELTITVSGELRALNSEDIRGPMGLRQAGISQVKIADIVPEGTVVSQGDYVATLDRTELANRLKDLATDLEKIQSQYLQAKLDTALELRKIRDNIINMAYALEEKRLVLEGSLYEAPTIRRQAEIDVENAKRNLEMEKNNYQLKLQLNRAKMQEVAATLQSQQNRVNFMMELLGEFTIKAPKDGMVIYKKDWGGNKVRIGSTINIWDPTVATLPDLSQMVSRCYVNEIDISKVKAGMPVKLNVDAFPQNSYTGKVTKIANIGEEMPGSNVKVFEVEISIAERDSLLLPAMSTRNTIIAQTLPRTVHIPHEALFGSDSFYYIYMYSGGRMQRQQVEPGIRTEDKVQIKRGVEAGQRLLLHHPADTSGMKVARIGG